MDHTLEWTLDPDGSSVTYTVDVPHALNEVDLVDPLRRGLVFSRDGATLPLSLIDHHQRALSAATRVTLHARTPHPPGELRLSNGNLLDATSRSVLRLDIHRDLNLLHAPADVQATSPLARTLEIETAPAAWWERLHRWATLPGHYRRYPIERAQLMRNESTPLTALLGGVLLLILAYVGRTSAPRQAMLTAGPLGLAALATLWCTPLVWATAGLALAVAAIYDRRSIPLAIVAVAASTNITGLPILTALASVAGRKSKIPGWVVLIATTGVAGLQLARVLGS